MHVYPKNMHYFWSNEQMALAPKDPNRLVVERANQDERRELTRLPSGVVGNQGAQLILALSEDSLM